ncbi:MAG: Lipopolysaccharide assembly protein A [Gammaproteobacteria bacterium]|nr:Lipopolysaccharide assembly protein A [Gammaproteobacteria bacterium]
MKLFIYLLLALVALLFGISFALKNPQSVAVAYYFGLEWSGSLSWLLVIALAVGALLGVLFTLGWVIKAKRQAGHLRREASQLESEAASLRPLVERGK